MTDPATSWENTRNAHLLRRGFTLTELMVALGLSAILLLVVAGVLSSGGEGFSQATRRIDANVEARAALSALADDLSTMRWDNLNVGLEPEGEPWPNSALWFLSLKPRRAQESAKSAGDLCFVHYYTAVTRELEGESGPYSRKLYRRLVSSSEVLAELKKKQDAYADPDADPLRPEDEPVAFNVVQFKVEAKVMDDDRIIDWKPTGNDEPTPDFFDVTLVVTDDATASLLKEKEDWEGRSELSQRFLGSPGEDEEGTRLRKYHVTIRASQ